MAITLIGLCASLLALATTQSVPVQAAGRTAETTSLAHQPQQPRQTSWVANSLRHPAILNYLFNFHDTGQDSDAKPAMAFCNGTYFLAWQAVDQSLYIAASSSPNTLGTVTHFGVTMWRDLPNAQSTGPALACFKGASQSHTELWVAYVSEMTKQIYSGYWDGNPSHAYLQYDNPVSNAYSNYSPALTVDTARNYLRLAFTGTNNQLNITYSTTGDSWATWPNTWTSQTTTGGLGLAYYCPPGQSCNPYIAWIGNGNPYLNIGYWNANAGQFVKVQTLNYVGGDCYGTRPGADATLVADGGWLFLLFPTNGGYVGDAWSTNASSSTLAWNCEEQYSMIGTGVSVYYGVAGALYAGSNLYGAFPGTAEGAGILCQGSFAP